MKQTLFGNVASTYNTKQYIVAHIICLIGPELLKCVIHRLMNISIPLHPLPRNMISLNIFL